MNPHSSNSSLEREMIMTDAPAILVLGETGAGKSYFINTLAPGTAEVGNRLESCEPAETVFDRVHVPDTKLDRHPKNGSDYSTNRKYGRVASRHSRFQ